MMQKIKQVLREVEEDENEERKLGEEPTTEQSE